MLFICLHWNNIFSVQAATKKGDSVKFDCSYSELGIKFNIKIDCHFCYLNTAKTSKTATCSLKQLHKILRHINLKNILKLQDVKGKEITKKFNQNHDMYPQQNSAI